MFPEDAQSDFYAVQMNEYEYVHKYIWMCMARVGAVVFVILNPIYFLKCLRDRLLPFKFE